MSERKLYIDLYSSMMSSDAWKDLEAYAQSERERSMKHIDSKSASDLTLGEVCEERGFRKGIMKIFNYAHNRRNGI